VLVVWVLAGYTSFFRPAAAQAPPSEYDLKAAFLMNFTKFVEWPPEVFPVATSPITICVLGEDPFGPTLDQMLEGEVVNSRTLAARRIETVPAPRACHVLFLSSSERDIPQILKATGPGVLTVSEVGNFLQSGGMINFVVENRRVRFDINQSAATAAKLRISSQLLKVARVVR
jgi:hypothetical protein